MAETLYVDAHHRLPDEDWAAVVARAEEITREAAENKTGGAAPLAGPVIDMRGRSNKHSGISGIPTQLLVLHSAECPLMPGYAQSLTEWAITSNVVASWQRFIGPDARVYMIEDHHAAWHASEANPMSIGWEQAGYARYTRAEWLTPNGLLQLESLAYDMAQVALRDGIPAVWLTTAQVTAVTTYGDRATKGFCLHRQIDPETRTDPGDGYPYDLLMARIRVHMGTPTIEQEIEDIMDTAEQAALALLKMRIARKDRTGKQDGITSAEQVFANFNQTMVRIFERLDALDKRQTAHASLTHQKVNTLTELVAASVAAKSGLTAEEVRAAVGKGLADTVNFIATEQVTTTTFDLKLPGEHIDETK